eukprot:14717473-Alexandrium_andersonii.AAC.1
MIASAYIWCPSERPDHGGGVWRHPNARFEVPHAIARRMFTAPAAPGQRVNNMQVGGWGNCTASRVGIAVSCYMSSPQAD